MTTQRKILKVLIIIIIAVFLLATGLSSVMYLVADKNPTDIDADMIAETGVVATDVVDTGKVIPPMTREEAQRQLEQLLSWNKK